MVDQQIIDQIKSIGDKYNANIATYLESGTSKFEEINKKYQLPAGTEKNFNNIMQFLLYANIKNSDLFESYSNTFTEAMRKILLKYVDEILSNQDITKLLELISAFNNNITSRYDISETGNTQVKHLLSDIFGIIIHDDNQIEIEPDSNGDILIKELYNDRKDFDMGLLAKPTEEYIELEQEEVTFINFKALIALLIIDHINGGNGRTLTINNKSDGYEIIKKSSPVYIPQGDITPTRYSYKNKSNKFSEITEINTAYELDLLNNQVPIITAVKVETFVDNVDVFDLLYIDENHYDNEQKINKLKDDILNNDLTLYELEGKDNSILRRVYYWNDQDRSFQGSGKWVLRKVRTLKDKYIASSESGYDIYNFSQLEDSNDNKLTAKDIIMNSLKSSTNTTDGVYGIQLANIISIYKTGLSAAKIQYQFEPVTFDNSSSTEEDIKRYKESEKRYANATENYYIKNKKFLPTLISLENIIYNTEVDEELDTALKELTDLEATDPKYPLFSFSENSNTVGQHNAFSINILYKETNPYVRNIILSDYYEKMISFLLIYRTGKLNTTIYDLFMNDDYGELDTTPKEIQLVKSLRSNSYICHSGTESDIISYIVGSPINFGINETELNEIEGFLQIYRQTREYFYKVLLNKAFILEETYKTYEKFYITIYSVERWLSSKIDNLRDINYFDNEDCTNFFICYGLGTLDKQISDNRFPNALLYKKRIIAAYTDLMSYKGSKKVIDIFFRIFNFGENEIELNRYILYKEPSDIDNEGNLMFLDVPYNSKNISNNLKNSKSKIQYDQFLENNKYWTTQDVPETQLSKIIKGPQSTKFLGLKLTQNLYQKFIDTKYSLSFVDYYEKILTAGTTSFSGELKNISVNVSLDGLDKNVNMNVYNLFNLSKLLFILYTNASQVFSGVSTDIVYPSGTDSQKKYGFNLFEIKTEDKNGAITIDPFSSYNEVNNVVTSNFVKYNPTASSLESKFIDKEIPLFQSYYKNKTNSNYSETDVPNLKAGLLYSTELEGNDKVHKTGYSEFLAKTSEKYVPGAIPSELISEALHSSSMVYSLNTLFQEKDKELFTAIYYLNKAKNNNNVYPSVENGTWYNDIFDNNLTFSQIYENIYAPMYLFARKYLNGEYNSGSDIWYNKYTKDLTDELFSKYFVTSEESVPYLSNTSTEEIVMKNGNKNTSDSKKINALVSNIVSDNSFTIEDLAVFLSSPDKINVSLSADNKSIAEIKYLSTVTGAKLILDELYNKLVGILEAITNTVSTYNSFTINWSIDSATNSFLDFVINSVEFFISYTTELYDSSIVFSYDNKGERIPLSFEIKQTMTQPVAERVYYDDSIRIRELDKTE